MYGNFILDRLRPSWFDGPNLGPILNVIISLINFVNKLIFVSNYGLRKYYKIVLKNHKVSSKMNLCQAVLVKAFTHILASNRQCHILSENVTPH